MDKRSSLFVWNDSEKKEKPTLFDATSSNLLQKKISFFVRRSSLTIDSRSR
jgi:hypothetical protein